jgi:hypothetical protein
MPISGRVRNFLANIVRDYRKTRFRGNRKPRKAVFEGAEMATGVGYVLASAISCRFSLAEAREQIIPGS